MGNQYAAKLGNDAERRTTKPLKIVHSGVCGPMRNLSVEGANQFVTFIDDFFEKSMGVHDKIQRRVV